MVTGLWTNHRPILITVLERWGKVTDLGASLFVEPNDHDDFTNATDFSRYEAKYGGYNVVPHELSRLGQILTEIKNEMSGK